MIIGSAMNNQCVDDAIQAAEALYIIQTKNIQTSNLNQFVERTIQRRHPPQLKGKRLRIYYMIQKSNNPHTFLLYINHKHLVDRSWMRYFTNQLRSTFDLNGVTEDCIKIRVVLKQQTY